MRFLIIILCLLSEKYLTHQFFTFRKKWCDGYAQCIERFIPSAILNYVSWGRYAFYMGSLGILCMIMAILGQHGLGLIINFLFELAVFYICLGEHNLFYINANHQKLMNDNEFILAMNQEFYAVILWFFILGPIGALFYRVTLYFYQQSSKRPVLIHLKAFLDWLPVRMSALLLLLVGQFQPGFTDFIKQINLNPLENDKLLIQAARQALNIDKDCSIDGIQLENIFNHSCLLLVFLLAIYVIGQIF